MAAPPDCKGIAGYFCAGRQTSLSTSVSARCRRVDRRSAGGADDEWTFAGAGLGEAAAQRVCRDDPGTEGHARSTSNKSLT